MIVAFIIGFLCGYIGSIPIAGPVAALVLARGLKSRFRSGIFIAVGAGIAEAGYAFLALWGFGTLLVDYSWITPLSRGVGALIIAVLAVVFLRPSKHDLTKGSEEPAKMGVFQSTGLGFTITLFNPTLIATWTAAAATLYSTELITFSTGSAIVCAVGVSVGIAAWFATMLALIARMKVAFKHATLEKLRRAVGVLLVGLAIWFGVRFAQYFMM